MLQQGALATIKHSWEKVRLIAGLSKGDNSLFVPMVIIRSSGNSEMKDRLILRHKLTISVRFVPGQVCVDVTHSTYLAFQQGQPIGQWLPQANWGCNSCVQGEERTWQKVNSWALVTQTLHSLCVLRHCHSSTQEGQVGTFAFGLVLNLNHLLFIPLSMSLSLDLEICLPKQRFWLAWVSYLVSICSSEILWITSSFKSCLPAHVNIET